MQSEIISVGDDASVIRIDKLFYYLRFAKTRAIAQKMCKKRFVRLNGKRVQSGHEKVVIGSLITMPRGDDIITIAIEAIPPRRGSAPEAQSHYHVIN